MPMRVSVDIGGTFTDFVCLDEETGNVIEEKAHTTPANFADGVINAIGKAKADLAEVRYFVHGTTVVINAITERKGAKTALITTKGFRDVLEIGRANRPDMYNYFYRKPVPYVPRHLRLEIDERVDYLGRVLRPVRPDKVRTLSPLLREEGVTAVAVCLLNSYANSKPEEDVRDILAEAVPEMEITISSELLKVWREYERTSTTVLNAYVKPAARLYMDTLSGALEKMGLAEEPHAMQSNGGTATFGRAKEVPISLIESGPVGGVIGGAALGKILGEENIITFDVGGTTAKTSLINHGEVKITTDYRLEWTPRFAGYPVKNPVVDIIEIGAGGGSIAWIDEVGILKVGPMSAGADPGPACYNIGGTKPTLTDANLVTGRINPDNFLGGTFKISMEKAREAIQPIADHFRISVEDAAMGIIQTAASNMLNALKLISVRRGYDPQDFAMLAQGGNGAVLSPYLAGELKVKKLIIPNLPGTFSAWGMLMTNLRQDFMQTNIMSVRNADTAKIGDIFQSMEEKAYAVFDGQKIARGQVIFIRTVEMRYIGQEHAVPTPFASAPATYETLAASRRQFDELHLKHYAFHLPDAETEIVSFNLTAYGIVKKPEVKRLEYRGELADAVKGERDVLFGGDGNIRCTVYDRAKLAPGHQIGGPAIVEESKSVTVLCPRQKLNLDQYGNLVIYNSEV
ncbi:MAG: hydantoinase/oxoprolinase family protein [Synergistaceae bacterium]|nr:hydantoinase/oxoprolinase family protein [Synergistaceae bacterium]